MDKLRINMPYHRMVMGWDDFAEWFNDHVEPINKLLAEGVAVVQFTSTDMWTTKPGDFLKEGQVNKALLIGIKPIVKETASDVLRELIGYWEDQIGYTVEDDGWNSFCSLLNKAKAVLEQSDG